VALARKAEGAGKLPTADDSRSGVQSVQRAFELLELIVRAGGDIGISVAAGESGLPLPTIHRLLQTLVAAGYVRQLPSRRYALGARLIPLGDGAQQTVGRWAYSHLASIVQSTGETANMAMLDGDMVIYVAQVPSRHAMRMFTEIGRRVALHCTGVGKMLLSQMSDDKVRETLKRTGLAAQTSRTITNVEELLEQLAAIRNSGFSVDDGEQEVGVRCVAVLVPHPTLMASLSISGPESRIAAESIADVAQVLAKAAAALSADLLASDEAGRPAADGARPG
jgi:IclR family acetate operon transcriptional repressor